jgi:hypothetical protein
MCTMNSELKNFAMQTYSMNNEVENFAGNEMQTYSTNNCTLYKSIEKKFSMSF